MGPNRLEQNLGQACRALATLGGSCAYSPGSELWLAFDGVRSINKPFNCGRFPARCCRRIPAGNHIQQELLPCITLCLSWALARSIPCIVRSTLAPGGGGSIPAHIGSIQPIWDVLPTVPAGTRLAARWLAVVAGAHPWVGAPLLSMVRSSTAICSMVSSSNSLNRPAVAAGRRCGLLRST
jgi:hypothetical protein